MSRSPRSTYAWYDPRRWPSLLVFVVALMAVFLLSGVIASIGIRLAGSIPAWEAFMHRASPALFVWRWLAYAGVAWLWIRFWKPRVITQLKHDRDGGEQARRKLKRLELVVMGFIMVLELINMAKWLGGP